MLLSLHVDMLITYHMLDLGQLSHYVTTHFILGKHNVISFFTLFCHCLLTVGILIEM